MSGVVAHGEGMVRAERVRPPFVQSAACPVLPSLLEPRAESVEPLRSNLRVTGGTSYLRTAAAQQRTSKLPWMLVRLERNQGDRLTFVRKNLTCQILQPWSNLVAPTLLALWMPWFSVPLNTAGPRLE
jgi:hypothetical protein